MFKVGDTVRITTLLLCDSERGLQVGDMGTATQESCDPAVFFWRIRQKVGCIYMQLEKVDD